MLKRIILFSLILIACSNNKSLNVEKEKQAILNVLYAQQDAWNHADLGKYMEGYWKSDSLKFIGSKGIRYGYYATLEGYKKSYPNAEMMGILSFTEIQVDITSGTSAFVLGRWHLKRANDEPSGYFTLHFKKFDGKWFIVVDHSS